MKALRRDFGAVLDELARQGWKTETLGSNRLRARPPDPSKPMVNIADSADWRARRNVISELRRSGFVWPVVEARREKPSTDEAIVDVDQEDDEEEAPESGEEDTMSKDEEKVGAIEDRMDKVFSELKEARVIVAMAREHREACQSALVRAKSAYDASEGELVAAERSLAKAKEAFDQEFKS